MTQITVTLDLTAETLKVLKLLIPQASGKSTAVKSDDILGQMILEEFIKDNPEEPETTGKDKNRQNAQQLRTKRQLLKRHLPKRKNLLLLLLPLLPLRLLLRTFVR